MVKTMSVKQSQAQKLPLKLPLKLPSKRRYKIQQALSWWQEQTGLTLEKRQLAGRYLAHFCQFLERQELLGPQRQKLALAVSGGSDSMALLTLMALAQKALGRHDELRLFHLNHQTRPECGAEEAFVNSWAKRLNLSIQVFYPAHQLTEGGNFEARARIERRSQFFTALSAGELLFQGHHLDDSFEWHLRQKLRSGQLWHSIGIPVINGPVRRPLMAFSKTQLEGWLKLIGCPYCQDNSNFSDGPERNFLRLRVIPQIRQRFPNYLLHYVTQARALAQWESQLRCSLQVRAVSLGEKGALLTDPKEDSLSYDLNQLLRLLSDRGQGQISCHTEALIGWITRHQLQGPMNLTGGVRLFGNTHLLLVLNSKGLKLVQAFEQNLLHQLHKLGNIKTQIPELAVIIAPLPQLFLWGLIGKSHRNYYQSVLFPELALFLNSLKQHNPWLTATLEGENTLHCKSNKIFREIGLF
jgi:tRNA(Ile)-lysidine synthetase-like protein